MTSTESAVLDFIARNGSRLHYYLIAEDLRISAHYAYVICKGLERSGYVNFSLVGDKGICSLTEKGEDAVQKHWFFKLKMEREHARKRIKANKERISKNVEAINY